MLPNFPLLALWTLLFGTYRYSLLAVARVTVGHPSFSFLAAFRTVVHRAAPFFVFDRSTYIAQVVRFITFVLQFDGFSINTSQPFARIHRGPNLSVFIMHSIHYAMASCAVAFGAERPWLLGVGVDGTLAEEALGVALVDSAGNAGLRPAGYLGTVPVRTAWLA